MKLAVLVMVLLAAAATLSASAAAPRDPPGTAISARPGRRLSRTLANKTGLVWAAEGRQKRATGDQRTRVVHFVSGAGGTGPAKFAEKRHKLCLATGPCYMKKLVCPKQCGEGPGRLQKQHFPGWACVFDCDKCTSYC
uniref:Putative uridine nucleosidase 2 n=1 Tax=Anthurium amnicola TaxID=1678845 RepID=A0A1D1YNT0_9ARAE